jgi:hypothetical protein
MAKDSEIDKGKRIYYSTSPEEILLGSLGPLHRFGLGIDMSNELGKIGKSRFQINADGEASIGCPVHTYF